MSFRDIIRKPFIRFKMSVHEMHKNVYLFKCGIKCGRTKKIQIFTYNKT